MLLRYFTLIGFFLGIFKMSAQTFEPVGGPVHSQELALDQANECYLLFDNPGGDSLTLRWRKLELSMPDGWDADLCDYGLCYSGIPGNGIMNPVTGSTQPYLKLIVLPGAVEGAAWVWFRVWEDGNEDNFVDVYFNLHTQGALTAADPAAPGLSIYPNPVAQTLWLDNPSDQPLPVSLISASGEVFRNEILPANTRVAWPVDACPAGFYYVQTARKTVPLVIRY